MSSVTESWWHTAGYFTSDESTATSNQLVATADEDQGDSVHPKEKRKKTKKQRVDGGDGQLSGGNEAEGEAGVQGKGESNWGPSVPKHKKAAMAKKRDGSKNVAISGYNKRTEQRRLKRISDRLVDTVCFVCREKGHAAKTCPKAGGEGGEGRNNANTVVGLCYRCGSTKHTLARCKKPEDPFNPFPFASCFVCSGKGHLASACPQNKEKGIYPNGGSCKLCGEKMHLAKNCELRKKDMAGTTATTVFGTGGGGGADEDDFHAFKRKNTEISKEEKKEDQRRKRLDVKAGSHTGLVKAFDKNKLSSKPKKVVFF
ncbi:hypothetical protein L210DRAFT_3531192 [Boletus edulis BED1]|uniref:CCHC-type domain-containing protein n=1 Tax=Boletus edulis BED1 TaxID=1328754 RepID=A0AAD4GHR4_BOLED|nr:hypothetical protein L210DRAFT_3531192 [Boletus edulis BED1]